MTASPACISTECRSPDACEEAGFCRAFQAHMPAAAQLPDADWIDERKRGAQADT